MCGVWSYTQVFLGGDSPTWPKCCPKFEIASDTPKVTSEFNQWPLLTPEIGRSFALKIERRYFQINANRDLGGSSSSTRCLKIARLERSSLWAGLLLLRADLSARLGLTLGIPSMRCPSVSLVLYSPSMVTAWQYRCGIAGAGTSNGSIPVPAVSGAGTTPSWMYRRGSYFQRQYPCASSIGSWYYAIMDVPSRQLLPTAVSLCQQYRELVLRHHGCTVEAVTSNGSIVLTVVSLVLVLPTAVSYSPSYRWCWYFQRQYPCASSIEMDLRDSKCNCKTPSSTARTCV
jgi:hypothetical protein